MEKTIFDFIDYFEQDHEIKWSKSKTEEGYHTISYPTYDKEVSQFISAFYESEFIDYEYSSTLKKYNLKNIDEIDFNEASIELVKAVLTHYVRGERFCDGLWVDAIKSKIFLKCLNRLKDISMKSNK